MFKWDDFNSTLMFADLHNSLSLQMKLQLRSVKEQMHVFRFSQDGLKMQKKIKQSTRIHFYIPLISCLYFTASNFSYLYVPPSLRLQLR